MTIKDTDGLLGSRFGSPRMFADIRGHSPTVASGSEIVDTFG